LKSRIRTAVIVSATAEWRTVRNAFADAAPRGSPLGAWFVVSAGQAGHSEPVLYFHGGWGKIQAAASAQYVIDRWGPELLVNLGTCGGFEGEIERGTVILAEKTVVYDIGEEMLDPIVAIEHYTTEVDLSWLAEPYPQAVLRTTLVSADRDLQADDLDHLRERYGAVAADWESGAIAYVAARNDTRCLILRGVTDLVGKGGGEAYGAYELFAERADQVMRDLLAHLPTWIEKAF
jgi:adenosylhomocysteine nucleosidase